MILAAAFALGILVVLVIQRRRPPHPPLTELARDQLEHERRFWLTAAGGGL